jgi:hypothetical protein
MSNRLYLFNPQRDHLDVIDVASGRPLRWAAWHPDGWCLLVGNGGAVLRWDGARHEAVPTGTKHNLRGAAFSPDGAKALLVGNRGAALLLDCVTGKTSSLDAPTNENLRRAAFSPDGSLALIVGNAGTVLRYESSTAALTPVPGDRAHTLRTIAWRPDGAYALVGAYASRYAGYPRPHALYRCDGLYLQALLTSDEEDDFVAVEWHPTAGQALIAGYAYDSTRGRFANKLLTYDGAGFSYRSVEASGAVLGGGWHPGGEYALLCGEGGTLLRYGDGVVEQIESGTADNLVGPFWAPDGSKALFLCGPNERVYTV